jgi:hypothetical protein
MKEEFEDSKGVPLIIRSRKSKDRQHNCIYTGTDVCRTRTRGRVHIPVADPIIFLKEFPVLFVSTLRGWGVQPPDVCWRFVLDQHIEIGLDF